MSSKTRLVIKMVLCIAINIILVGGAVAGTMWLFENTTVPAIIGGVILAIIYFKVFKKMNVRMLEHIKTNLNYRGDDDDDGRGGSQDDDDDNIDPRMYFRDFPLRERYLEPDPHIDAVLHEAVRNDIQKRV